MAKQEFKQKRVMSREEFPYEWEVMGTDVRRMQMFGTYVETKVRQTAANHLRNSAIP